MKCPETKDTWPNCACRRCEDRRGRGPTMFGAVLRSATMSDEEKQKFFDELLVWGPE